MFHYEGWGAYEITTFLGHGRESTQVSERRQERCSERRLDQQRGKSLAFPYRSPPSRTFVLEMTKSMLLDQTQLIEAGVTPQHAVEISFFLTTSDVFSPFSNDRDANVTIAHRSTS